jgi:hypothetical protein
MEQDNIFSQIRKERQSFLQDNIIVVGHLTHNQYKRIKKNHLYNASHFEDGDYETINGVTRKKHFHNISSWRCEVATKMLDKDMKDFSLVATVPEQEINVAMLERETKHWMKVNKWSKILNQVVEELPVQGSSVIRKLNINEVEVVDLRYLYNDQDADTLKKSSFVSIRSFMNAGELRKMKGKWNNVEKILDEFDDYKATTGYDEEQGLASNGVAFSRNNTHNLVEVWTRWGEYPLSWITEKESDSGTYVWGKFVVCGADNVETNDKGEITGESGVVLWAEELDKDKDFPFKEVHYTKIKGRWQGVGIVEKLEGPQQRINEIKNQEAKALELASLQIFQTRSTNIMSNVLTDSDTGDIVQSNSEITPIATESRNLGGFTNAYQSEDQHSDRLTFSYNAVTGEQSPATATLGSIEIERQQATSAFDFKSENVSIFFNEFIEDIILPTLEKIINQEHVFKLTGSIDELAKYRRNIAEHYVNEMIVNQILNGELPKTKEELMQEAMKEISKKGAEIWTKVQKNFYKNLNYYVDLVSSNENNNLLSIASNGVTILKMLQDPTILQDPAKRTILFKVLSSLGMDISELDSLENKVAEGQAAMQTQGQQPTQAPSQLQAPQPQIT